MQLKHPCTSTVTDHPTGTAHSATLRTHPAYSLSHFLTDLSIHFRPLENIPNIQKPALPDQHNACQTYKKNTLGLLYNFLILKQINICKTALVSFS